MEQLFGAIPSVLNDLEPNPIAIEAVVFAAWNRCSGDLLRTRTLPLGFSENRLTIAVEDKTWQRHLEDLSPQMLAKLNGSLGHGTIRFIEFRIDKAALDAARSINPKSDGDAGEALDAVAPSLITAAGAIADDALRKRFLSAAAGYLAKQNRDR